MEKKNQLFDKSIQKKVGLLKETQREEKKNHKITWGKFLATVITVIFAASVIFRMFIR